MTLVLSLFPGIGLLDLAFEAEGFCVVRGPDVLWGGDIRTFNPPAGRFDGIIGGPPCQMFSRLAHMVRHNGHQPKFGNLIPEFERCVAEAQPQWFAMENVPDAPLPAVEGYGVHSFVLNNRQCIDEDGKPAKQMRTRRWSFGWRGGRKTLNLDVTIFENHEFEYAACGGTHGEGGIAREQRKKTERLKKSMGTNIKSSSSFARLCELQGLPEGFDLPPFTVAAKCKAVGNGVPLPMGRTIARGIKETCQ
jgi:DNA (cytosine-5)-methyltransferase 1